jgi:aminoglycoside phosphotransferase (APT) family kinase protein
MDEYGIYLNVKCLIEKKLGEKVELEITNFEFINDGFSNDIVIFNLKYYTSHHEFSKEVVFKDYSKSYKGNNGLTKYKKELSILKNFQSNNFINVPQVYFTDEERKLTLMEKINGERLDRVDINDQGKFNNAMKMFGKSLAYVHLIDFKTIDKDICDLNINSVVYFKNYIESLENRIVFFNEQEYLPILHSIRDRFKAIDFTNVCLNHGDYHFLNTILTNKDKLYILDWEKAKIADCRYDIANTLVLGYSWFGIDFKKRLLDGYEIITGKSIDDLGCFEALKTFDSFSSCIPLIQGEDDSHIRDRSFKWVKRRYELFVENTGMRNEKAEEYLKTKGFSL